MCTGTSTCGKHAMFGLSRLKTFASCWCNDLLLRCVAKPERLGQGSLPRRLAVKGLRPESSKWVPGPMRWVQCCCMQGLYKRDKEDHCGGVVSPSIDLRWAKSARQAARCSLGISKVDECACMLVAERPKCRVEFVMALRYDKRYGSFDAMCFAFEC